MSADWLGALELGVRKGEGPPRSQVHHKRSTDGRDERKAPCRSSERLLLSQCDRWSAVGRGAAGGAGELCFESHSWPTFRHAGSLADCETNRLIRARAN